MADETTTTVFLTTTVTSTRILTRTILSVASSSSSSGYHIKPADDASSNNGSSHMLYPYKPSFLLAIIFTVLYFIMTAHHAYISFRLSKRADIVNKHRYTVPLLMAGVLSTAGYLVRCISIQKPHSSSFALYTTSTALVIISPIFVCATLYLLLTRLIIRCLCPPTINTPVVTQRTTGKCQQPQRNPQRFFFLSPTLLSIFFIASDIVSFLTQMSGALLASSANWTGEPNLSRGTHILLGGLTLQLATFVLFLVTLHVFCRRVRNSTAHGFNPCIMKVVIAAWIAAGFVLVRTLFRLVEFAAGSEGYPYRHEWCLYAFDALPVWLALAVLAWWHPIKWIQEPGFAATTTTTTIVATAGDVKGRRRRKVETIEIVLRQPVAGINPTEMDGHARRRSAVGFAM